MVTHRPVGMASLVATTAAVLLTTSMARGDLVRVEATRQGDRAQVVLVWPAPVGLSSEIHDGRLHVRFDRPVEGDFWAIRTLRRFTRLPTAGGDGTSLTFPLQREIDAVASADGEKVVIDFRVAKARLAAAPASPVQAPSPDPTAGEAIARRVNVSTGQHPGLTRVVFEWPEPVGYSVEGAPGTVIIVFDRPAEFDARQFKRKDLKYIQGGQTRRLGDTTKVTLNVPAGSSYRDMRENNKVVVEILAPSKSAGLAAPATAADPTAQPQPQPPGPALMQVADPSLSSASVATDPASASAPTGEAASSPKASAPAVQPAKREAPLRFSWDRPVAAAVFRRGGMLWCVFDAPSKQDVAGLAAAAGAGVRIEQQPHERATVLSISGEAGLAPRLERQGLAWILRLAADGQTTASGRSITPLADASAPNGPRLLLPVPEPGVPLAVADPEIGNTLVVVPVIPLSTRMAATHTYPQFLLQASLQGIVVQPLIDTLRVRPLRDGVELTSTDGLILSPPFDAAPMAGRSGAASDTHQRLLDAGDWIKEPAKDFAGRRQALERAAMESVGADRERNRLRLAQFLLGHRFAAEVLGALTLAAEERPSLVLEPKFLLLRGAAQLLSGRAPEAREDLARASLSGADEARLWAAATGVVVGEAPHDLSRVAQWTAIIAGYPAALRGPLSSWLAEAAIEGGAPKEAEKLIGLATAEANTAEARAQAAYLEGLRKQKAGDVEGALASFEQAAGIDPRRGRARAELARTLLLRQQDRLSLEQAVAALEDLRFAWRGDALEYRLLRELGRLYLQAGDYPAGLRSLKVALSDFPGIPGAAETTRDMARAFEQLFLEGAAERLSPITALALYEEFRELTPAGEKGGEMVRRLAERLGRVELLDRAASLLDGLLPQLSQPQKARLGAQLAEIRLRDGKPDAALADLRRTAGSDLPPDLQRQRALSQARALGTLGRGDDALLAIARDESVDAELLRAKLHRDRGDWDRTAAALRRALQRARSDPAAALSEQHGRDVLDLAVALTLAGSDSQLADLDREYGAAMAATPLKDAFQLIAGGAAPTGADAAALADMVQKAMAFRKSLGTPASTPPAR